ncbi:hypothetical protein FRC02_005508 [Tulasnella sp. 418]|nr:hypothetical protein FRC02_005508 [Tulasnella sp. 418]
MIRLRSFLNTAQLYALLVILCITPSSWAARDETIPEPDPFADPKNDPYNPLRYIPSDTLTAIALLLYLATAGVMFYNIWKWGAKYMLYIPIGALCMCFGLAIRFAFARNPHSLGIYIGTHMFVVLSPCAFIAAVYVLLGRLVGHLRMDKYLFIKSTKVTKIFVTSDVVTFLIQAGGGGISASRSTSSRELGEKLFVVGLILQIVSFIFFCILFAVFMYRLHHNRPDVWNYQRYQGVPWHSDWKIVAVSLVVSCIGIIIRSFYRVAEGAQGFGGPLATNEGLFYALDTYPLLIAIAVYIPFWPGRILEESTRPSESESNFKRVAGDDGERGTPRSRHMEMNSFLPQRHTGGQR